MTYANKPEREQLVIGLRTLADFLDANPSLPVPPIAEMMVFPQRNADPEMRSEVDRIANILGAVTYDEHGHYQAACSFGPVQYRAIAILKLARDDYAARTSYAENIGRTNSSQGA